MREVIERCKQEVRRLKGIEDKPDNIKELVDTLDEIINRLEDDPLDNEAVRMIRDYFKREMNVD